MNPVVLWTTCAHGSAHVVDLTMSGALLILVSGVVGWFLRGGFDRGRPPACKHGRDCANCGVGLNWPRDD